MKIFISYASGDRSRAEEIAFSLRDRGHEVALDRDDLCAGEGLEKSIAQAVTKSEFFIVFMSLKTIAEGRDILTEARQDANEGALSEWVLKKRPQEADAVEDALIQSILQADYQSLREEYVSHGLDPDQAIAIIDSAIERAKSSDSTQQVQRAELEVNGAETPLPLQASHTAFSGHGFPSSGEAIGPPRTAIRDRVRTLWQMLSLRYAIASTAAIIFIVGLVGLFLHGSWPSNRPEARSCGAAVCPPAAGRGSKDAEIVVIWPSTPQAGVKLCNELQAGNVICNLVQGGDQAQIISLTVSMPPDKAAGFCKKIEAGGNACQSSFIAGMPNNTAR
jgi:hypothetical protein